MKMRHLTLLPLFLLSACGDEPKESKKAAEAVPVSSPSEVMGIAVIEPAGGISKLAPAQAGTIGQILALPGQKLDSGQVILRLEHRVELAQLAQSSARMNTQQDAVGSAQASLILLETQLSKAEADLKRDEALFSGNAITRKELDDSKARVSDLRNQVAVQRAQVKQQTTRLGELRAEGQYYQQVLAKTNLVAPAKGVLLSLDVRNGEFLDGRTEVGEFAPDGPIVALTEIDELFASQVQLGQKAEIRQQGSDRVLGTGKVVLASPYLRKKSLFSDNPANLEDRRVREVRVQLDDPSKVLIGARVECIIKTQ